MRIPLTPGQAVSVHGWLAARQWLTWGDVLASDTLTFKSLLSFRLSEAQLHNLQPDIHAWIRNHKVQLEDAPSLLLWSTQPVKEMKADLADVVSARWTAEQMTRIGLTYHDLVALGLTAENMILFNHITLMGWAQLGLRREHADKIQPPILYRLFGMSKNDVVACLK